MSSASLRGTSVPSRTSAARTVELEDGLLHGPARDQPIDGHGALLPEAVGSVGRLILHGGVPPRVKMDHVVGGGKVEPLPARLQADEEEIALARRSGV